MDVVNDHQILKYTVGTDVARFITEDDLNLRLELILLKM